MAFTKKDFFAAVLLGEIVAWLGLAIHENLEILPSFHWALWAIALPLAALLGVYAAFLIGRKIPVVWQIAKFGSVGVLNTLVDWGVLNLLIFLTQIFSGPFYSLFKSASFVVAVLNSYFWNKFWTFSSAGGQKKTSKEFFQYILVSLVGFGINVGAASFLVNVWGAPAGVEPKLWANAGALLGTVLGMTWNFLGYKLIVFKTVKS